MNSPLESQSIAQSTDNSSRIGQLYGSCLLRDAKTTDVQLRKQEAQLNCLYQILHGSVKENFRTKLWTKRRTMVITARRFDTGSTHRAPTQLLLGRYDTIRPDLGHFFKPPGSPVVRMKLSFRWDIRYHKCAACVPVHSCPSFAA